jgi:hypothetical protein
MLLDKKQVGACGNMFNYPGMDDPAFVPVINLPVRCVLRYLGDAQGWVQLKVQFPLHKTVTA